MGKVPVAWLNINYVLAPRPSFGAKVGTTEGVVQYATDNPSKKLCLEILGKGAIAVQHADTQIMLNVDGGKIIEDPDFPPKQAAVTGLEVTQILPESTVASAQPMEGAPNAPKKGAAKKHVRKKRGGRSRNKRAKGR